jgi:hypothetical protein
MVKHRNGEENGEEMSKSLINNESVKNRSQLKASRLEA